MRGEITHEGGLVIWRDGLPQIMKCQYGSMNCGHWCPKFGEPRKPKDEYIFDEKSLRQLLDRNTIVLLENTKINVQTPTEIKLCGGDILRFNEFEDLRGKG